MAIHITGDDKADEVLDGSPFALLLGMLLDQQYPMEHAFRGPAKILDRFGSLEPAEIADAEPESFASLCAGRARNVRAPRAAASATAASKTIVLPIPGSPSIATAHAGARVSRKRAISVSSSSLPTRSAAAAAIALVTHRTRTG